MVQEISESPQLCVKLDDLAQFEELWQRLELWGFVSADVASSTRGRTIRVFLRRVPSPAGMLVSVRPVVMGRVAMVRWARVEESELETLLLSYRVLVSLLELRGGTVLGCARA